MADQSADQVTPDTIAQVTANLEAYISERAQTKAEAALARARLEADERVKAVREELGTALRYEAAVAAELRRHLEAAHRTIDRQQGDIRDLRVGRREAQAEADAERASNDALRKNRDQLNDELRGARDELARVKQRSTDMAGLGGEIASERDEQQVRADQAEAELQAIRAHDEPTGSVLYGVVRGVLSGLYEEDAAVRQIEQRLVHPLIARQRRAEADARRARPSRRRQQWASDLGRRTVARLIDAWEDGADPGDTLRAIRDRVRGDDPAGSAEPVIVPEGTPPAMQRCPHRDFDDPTPCGICP